MRSLAFLCALALTALGQAPKAPGLYADVQTSKGLIVIQLKPEYAPMAVANFVGLAEGTIANAALDPGQPFFDNSTFHRVVAGHVIQTGIPHSTRARGPGYSFPNEIDERLSHNHAGAVNMANGGPGTNASQWCITLGDRSYLDGDFTVFGEVVQGLDVVLSIREGDALDSVRIVRVGRKANAYHPNTASFQAMVAAAKQRALEQEARKQQVESAWITRNFPKAEGPAGGVLTVTLATGPDSSVAPRRLLYRGREIRYIGDWAGRRGADKNSDLKITAFGSGPGGVPGFNDARPFDYVPGSTKLIPGLERVVATMHAGDRRTVIVPAAQGYGRGGLYPPEVKGQPRFVISPNALLVYDLEALN